MPSKSAYTVHVMQMCDAISKKKTNLTLFVPFKDKKLKFHILSKEYGLKHRFKIKSIFKSKKNLNLFTRIIFAINCIIQIKKKKKIIY